MQQKTEKKDTGTQKKHLSIFSHLEMLGFFSCKLVNGRNGQRKVISDVFLDQQKENVL